MKNNPLNLNQILGALVAAALLTTGSWLSAANIFRPGDPITGTSGNVSGDGAVTHAIDGGSTAKYLNFDKLNTGFTTTPSAGPSRATGLTLVAANDSPDRDPTSFILMGSRDGGATFTVISAQSVPFFATRFARQDFTFQNTAVYTTYKIVFPTINASSCCMQIGEVQLTGDLVATDTFPPVIASISAPDSTHVVIRASEGVNIATAVPSFDNGLIPTGASQSADKTTVTLTTTPQTPGLVYTLTVNGVKDLASPANPMAANTTAKFVSFQAIGVDFLGRDGNGTPPPGIALGASDVAGVVPQANWNEIDNGNNGNSATTGVLNDNTGAATPVTLNYACNDTWFNDGPSGTPDEKLMYGVIKQNSGNSGNCSFTFNNVPDGTYDLYVYMDVNGDGVQINLSDGLTTYYTVEQHRFAGSYAQASNRDPAGFRDTGNYVKFTKVNLSAGQIALAAKYVAGGDGLGIAGFQLVRSVAAPPVLLAAAAPGATTVSLTFDQTLADDSVNNLGNFIINNGATVSGATLSADKSHINLTTSALTPGATYTITVSGAANRATSHDVMATTSKSFGFYVAISVDFKGRNNSTPPAGTGLAPSDVAGVVPLANWNGVDEGNHGDFDIAGLIYDGSGTFVDSSGAPTPVTISYNANDNWNNDDGTAPASMTANQKMMYGIIKNNGGNNATAYFYFNNVPQGAYDLYAYLNVNGDNVQIDLSDGLTTYYSTEQHRFTDGGGAFILASSTNPGVRDLGNYVKFSNVYLSGAGQISLSAHWNGGGDGLGIAGFQLVQVSDAYPPKIARAQGGVTTVNVIYTEPVSDDAANIAHYSLSGGLTISAGSLDASKRVVTLTTSPQTKGATYTVTVNGVVDRSPAANPIVANSTANFTPQYGLNIGVAFRGGAGGPGITPTPMRPTDVAGVVATPNYNNINGQVNLGVALSDTDGFSTPVTITFRADEQWGSGTGEPGHTTGAGNHGDVNEPNHRLFNEYLGPSNDPHHGRDIVLKNVPYSTYNLIVYTGRDGDGQFANYAGVGNGPVTTYHVNQDGADHFIDNFVTDGQARWVRGLSTTTGSHDLCNYVQFDNIQPDALGQIRIPIQSENFRACTPGLQLIDVNPAPLQFITQPVDTTAKETKPFSISAAIVGPLPHNVQWFSIPPGGMAAPIVGANSLTYSGTATAAIDGTQFYVVVDNGVSTITSSTVTLHVLVDNTPPTLVEATADPIPNTVRLLFSEGVTAAPGNFMFLVGGLNVTATEILPDLKTVLLTTDNPLVSGQSYQLKIMGVQDLAGVPNTIDPNPTIVNFTGWACTNGVLLRQFYFNESGPNLFSTLFNDPNFPCNPGQIDYITSFNSPQTPLDHYGLRVRGYLLPTETGDYFFRLHSDDSGRLSVSTDSSEANLVTLIDAQGDCGGCGSPLSSTPVHLVAGHAYFVQGLMQEGTGGDYLEVSWRNSGGIPSFTIIPGANLSYCVNPDSLVVQITGPNDTTVVECRSATFSVTASATCGAGSASYQWQKDTGSGFTDIPGANSPSYTTPLLQLADDNTLFHVVVTLVGNTTTSRDAKLTVIPDVIAPTVVSVHGDATLANIYITYSEAVDPVSATDGASYLILDHMGNGLGIALTGVMLDDHTVLFATDPQVEAERYTVIVNPSLFDLCQKNLIENPVAGFRAWALTSCFATFDVYSNIGGGLVSDLTGNPAYPNNPSQTFRLNSIDSRQAYPDDTHDNYGGRFTAKFTPPVDGHYTFYMENDDDAQFLLNGSVVVAHGCCQGTFDDAVSGGIDLVGGTPYDLLALYKEGGGGDYLRIAVRIPGDATPTANLPTINPSYLSTYVDLDSFPQLPTSGMLPLGTLTHQGFEGRLVKINPAGGTIPNSTATAEALLAGTYTDSGGGPYPNIASVPCFFETGIINYSIEASSYGHLPSDVRFPGFPIEVTANTENMAMEILTYVELTPGLHTFGVNSDDGFRVSPATSVSDANNSLTLGEFSGGRGASDTTFTFFAPQAGLYPMRVVWEQGNGGANIEWWEYSCSAGQYYAVNGPGGPRAFRAPASAPLPFPTCPTNIIANADPVHCQAVVTFTATVNPCPAVTLSCTPPSGSAFPLGPTTVNCTADDGKGDTSTCSFTVTVVDVTAPTVNCPGDITVDGNCQPTATVPYSAGAADCGGVLSFDCSPPGDIFPVGATTVTCTGVDRAGNSASCHFTVTVNADVTPPSIVCPPNMTVDATGQTTAVVTYTTPSASDPCGVIGVACVPPSGSAFPSGVTMVTCTATDGAGNSGSCVFKVTVNNPPVCALAIPCSYTNGTNRIVIALEEDGACVVLDASGSYDINHDPLDYRWIIDGSIVLAGKVVTNCLPFGCHSIALLVGDGRIVTICRTTVCVVKGSEAVQDCINLVESTTVDRKNKRPLIASLKSAAVSLDREHFQTAINQLTAFQHKVSAQISKSNPAAAAAFIKCAQDIIDAIRCAAAQGLNGDDNDHDQGHDHDDSHDRDPSDGHGGGSSDGKGKDK